jgi:acyl-CoA synthetase (AMP-forming)/AMP-acid ligase II
VKEPIMQPTDPLRAETIPALALAAADRFGEQNAIEDGATVLSFVELADAAIAAARAFAAAGVERGDRVAVWAPNVYEWIVAAIGLQSAGGVLVPLNTRLKGAEAGYVLNKSGARILCTVGDFLGTDYVGLLLGALGGAGLGRPVDGLTKLERIILLRGSRKARTGGAGIEAWADFLLHGEAVSADDIRRRAANVSAEDLSDILFTSGTTGKPKGVMSCHGQNLKAFRAWSEVIGLREGDRYLVVNPFFHAFGYKAGWMASLIRGATILPHPVFDVPAVLDRVGKERVSVLPGPPALYQSILAHPARPQYDLSCLRLAVTGAAPISVALINQMRDELGFETVITGYGLTEACGIATMCRFDDDPETVSTTSGRAIPDVEVRCIDASGTEVARGEPGEIVVRGYNVMKGYFDDEAATAATIDGDGWLHTGDIGVMDERGYIRITDRIKDMFIMGGFNCYPAEIESILVTHDDVVQAAVIGVADDRMGEVGMAFVVLREGAELSGDDVIAWSRENMANYKVPRYVEIVAELPMNAMNKVQKFLLRDRAGQIIGKRA